MRNGLIQETSMMMNKWWVQICALI